MGTIMPAFARWEQEAKHIGAILAGYGELEFELATCLAVVLRDTNTGFRVFFRIQGESNRIEITDALIKPHFEANELQGPYSAALGGMRWCKTVRNQYAHCHWTDDVNEGLFFARLEDAAKKATGLLYHRFLHVDAELLAQQEEFFVFVSDMLWYLHNEYEVRDGQKPSHSYEAPKIIHPPIQNNPIEEHSLPWSTRVDEQP